MNILSPIVGVSVLFAMACACGGQIVEFEVPVVTGTVPAADDPGVSITTPIAATFNVAMDETTLTSLSFFVIIDSTDDNEPQIDGRLAWDPDTHTLTLTPTATLPQNQRFTARVTTAAHSSRHVPLADDVVWHFATTGENVQSSSIVEGGVPAPDYQFELVDVVVRTDGDDVVQSAVGTVVLTAGTITGHNSVIVVGQPVGPADVAAAFNAATATAVVSSIDIGEFQLVHADLTTSAVRTLIINNVVEGVSSYQLLTVTFHRGAD